MILITKSFLLGHETLTVACVRGMMMGIYNLQYVMDPEKIVIGGAISARQDLLEQLQIRLDTIFSKLTHAKIKPVVVKCQFENDANMIGAVYHFMNS